MTLYKLCFYVPEAQAESVKDAVFAAGAGRIGNYDRCCFEVSGAGQFRPLDGSRPFIGQRGQTERVTELRVEMICEASCLANALQALRGAHPYEEPAIDVWKLEHLS